MNFFSPNLNADMDTLVNLLETNVNDNATGTFSFMPTLLEQSKLIRDEVQLSDAQLNLTTDRQQREQIGTELSDFCSNLRAAYTYKHKNEEMPEWLKSSQKTDADYYQTLFVQVSNLPTDFIEWFIQDTGMTPDIYVEKYNEWVALYEKEATHKDAVKKVEKALDLRALLFGALRLYGLSNFEIRKSLA